MKHVLVTVIIAIVVVPALAARDPDGRRGLRRMLWLLLAFNLAYVAWLTLVHATQYVPQR